MKFSKSSWHYRLLCWTYDAEVPPRSLCPYFWMVMFTLFIGAPVLLVCMAVDRGPLNLLRWIIGKIVDWQTNRRAMKRSRYLTTQEAFALALFFGEYLKDEFELRHSIIVDYSDCTVPSIPGYMEALNALQAWQKRWPEWLEMFDAQREQLIAGQRVLHAAVAAGNFPPKPEKQVGLFYAYWGAFWSKICPMIEWED